VAAVGPAGSDGARSWHDGLVNDYESGEVSRRIAAAPSTVYELVTDITHTGRWAQECEACHWLDGATVAAVGTRFEGRNRFGEHTWTTVSVVDEVVPQRRFSFHTVDDSGEPITRWRFTFGAEEDFTVVAERFERVSLPDSAERTFENNLFGGRVRHNLTNMAASLDALAALVEATDWRAEASLSRRL